MSALLSKVQFQSKMNIFQRYAVQEETIINNGQFSKFENPA